MFQLVQFSSIEVAHFENSKGFSFRGAALSRQESAASMAAAIKFLAGKFPRYKLTLPMLLP
jgi:hypothetical protein